MRRPELMRPATDAARRELVEVQLERILSSPLFSRSESLSRLLRYVVAATLAGRGAELREYILGVDVFDRGESFDPRCDTIVRVQARKLRAKLAEYYRNAGPADCVRIDLPKGGYVPVVHILHPATDPAPQSGSRLRLNWLPAAILVVAIVLSAWMARGVPRLRAIRGGTTSAEASDQYLRARYCWTRGDVVSVRNAISFYRKALAADPRFANAYAGLSIAYGSMGENMRAMETASRAIAVDGNSSKAHSALALALARDWNWTRAEEEARRAIALDPSDPGAHHILANVFLATGRTAEALDAMRRARDLEPISWRQNLRLAEVLVFHRDYARAANQYRTVLDLEPRMSRAWIGLAMALALAKDYPGAAKALEQAGERGDDERAFAVFLAASQGHTTLTHTLLADFDIRSSSPIALTSYVASAYALSGDVESALACLNVALHSHLATLPEMLRHPMFDSLRSYPAFKRLLRLTGPEGS